MADHCDDPVAAYICDYLTAVEQRRPPPSLAKLPAAARGEVIVLLAHINTNPDFEFEPPPMAPDAAERCRRGMPEALLRQAGEHDQRAGR